MRNLKKFLALVLAMVMAFSLMLSASAANGDYDKYTDKETVAEEFEEAVSVLTGLDVFKGDGPDDAKTFRPGDTITRAEVAAIIYRIATGDVEDKQVKIYADYSNFTDVKHDDWFAGYVGYCHNAQYIKGHANQFNPYGQVTGYEALAMILRAVGYDKNHEFEGASWQVNVSYMSKNLGVTANVENSNFDTTLNKAVTREVVADLLFQTAVRVPTVTYSPALGYNDRDKVIDGDKNPTLGVKIFNLHNSSWTVVDDWGHPGYYWYTGSRLNDSLNNVVATIEPKATKTYTETVRECDVASDLKISTNANFTLFVNNEGYITETYKIVATDTETKVGGQGRKTEFYKDVTSDFIATKLPNWCVMVDTYLAKVISVSNAVLDHGEHVITPAKLTVEIYDKDQTTDKLPNPTVPLVISKDRTDKTNWEYSKGDMILLNAWTDKSQRDFRVVSGELDYSQDNNGLNHFFNEEAANKAAFEYNRILTDYDQTNLATVLGSDGTKTEQQRNSIYSNNVTHAEVLGIAESQVAKQGTVYWNQEKHNVGGTDYPDNLCLFLDVAGTTVDSDFTWYFDQYKNVIGIGEATKSTFGVITSIYSSFNTTDGATDGTAKAIAHVKYADGTEADVAISQFLVSNTADFQGHKSVDGGQVELTTTKAQALDPVYDYTYSTAGAYNMVMKAKQGGNGKTAPSTANGRSDLYVSPVADINASIEGGSNTGGYYGIIKGNLFKFVTAGNGAVTAIEVAGKNGVPAVTNNDSIYVNLNNAMTDGAQSLRKNASYLTVDAGNNVSVRVDGETKIMIKDAKGDINVYDGTDALPSDVAITDNTEVDWSDTDNDGIANVLYTTGTVSGSITYGLFYYNNGAGEWNGKTGVLNGYMAGEPKALEFDNEAEFNLVKGATAAGYNGHLFAVQMTDGIVTNLMGHSTPTASIQYAILAGAGTLGTPGAAIQIKDLDAVKIAANGTISLTTPDFVCGAYGGNAYGDATAATANAPVTKAIWLKDDPAGTDWTWDRINNTITDGSDVYSLNGAKMVGDSVEYLNESVRNDVTVVFEDIAGTNYAAIEVYITTYRNVTPGNTGRSYSADLKIGSGGDLYVELTGTGSGSATQGYAVRLYSYTSGSEHVQIGGTFTGRLSGGTATEYLTGGGVAVKGMYFYAVVEIDGLTFATKTVLGNQ